MGTRASTAFLSASDTARKIRSRELTSSDVVRQALARIREHNPKLNAVVEILEDQALETARLADESVAQGQKLGPLHGVPVTLKDVHRMQGSRSTYGLPQYRNYVPKSDSWAAERLRKAGAVIIGRTNVPMGGFDWQCSNSIYGRTQNPWDLNRTPGGSSGGSAAAVAAGLVPLDIGSDIAGSIRYPAHCCGVMSLRPTDGLVPNWNLGPERLPAVFRSFLTSGPVARTLDDIELGLRVLCGPGAQGLRAAEPPTLRIAWADQLPGLERLPISEDTRSLLEGFVSQLASAGFGVEKRCPAGIDFDDAYELWGRIAGFDFTAGLPGPARLWPVRAGLGFGVMRAIFGGGPLKKGFARGLTSDRRAYFQALTRCDELRSKMDHFFESVDVWITPASPGEAIPHQKVGRPIQKVDYSDYLGGYLCPMGTLGHPILTIPVGLARSGLPIGLQLHGPRFGDFGLIEAARKLIPYGNGVGPPPAFAG